MTNDEMREQLRKSLTAAIARALGNNELDNQQQLEVLGDTFLSVLHLYGELEGEEHPKFSVAYLRALASKVDPSACVQRHATTRPTRGDYSNGVALDKDGHVDLRYSWHMVFPPASGLLLEASDFLSKEWDEQKDGISLTSMPDAVKQNLKKSLRELGYKIVAVESPLLALVVFGEGRAATTKLPIVQQHIAAGEDIAGIHYDDMVRAVLQLELREKSKE